MFLGLVALMGGLAGCEDRITEEEIPVDSGKLVTVPLTFDFAPETEGYEIASGSPRARLGLASGGGGGGGEKGGGGGGAAPPQTPRGGPHPPTTESKI